MADPIRPPGIRAIDLDLPLELLPLLPDAPANPADFFTIDPKGVAKLKPLVSRREALTKKLAEDPRSQDGLRQRIDTGKKILSFRKNLTAEETENIAAEMARDDAVLTALNADAETEKLDKIATRFSEAHLMSGNQKRLLLDQLLALAAHYALLSNPPPPPFFKGGRHPADQLHFFKEEEGTFVRQRIGGLFKRVFSLIDKFAESDFDPGIRDRKHLYKAHRFLLDGKTGEAMDLFGEMKDIFPEAAFLHKKLESDQKREMALRALQVWEFYNTERDEREMEKAGGIKGGLFGPKKEAIRKKWKWEEELLEAMKDKIASGEVETLTEALTLLKEDRSRPELAARAYPYWLGADNPSLIQALILFSKYPKPEDWCFMKLLEKGFLAEATEETPMAAYLSYSLVADFSKRESLRNKAKEEMEALSGKSNYSRAALKFLRAIDPISAITDVLLMTASAGVGAIAKGAALKRFLRNGTAGRQFILAARGAGVAAEGTTLWGLNTGREAWNRDIEKVFDPKQLAKSYGATLTMIGLIKAFAGAGEAAGITAAQRLGLTTAEGGINSGGKVLLWNTRHAAGLGGIITSTKASEALGFKEKPQGGGAEAVIHDIFTYVEYALAHKMVHFASGGKLKSAAKERETKLKELERRLKQEKIREEREKAETIRREAIQELGLSEEVLHKRPWRLYKPNQRLQEAIGQFRSSITRRLQVGLVERFQEEKAQGEQRGGLNQTAAEFYDQYKAPNGKVGRRKQKKSERQLQKEHEMAWAFAKELYAKYQFGMFPRDGWALGAGEPPRNVTVGRIYLSLRSEHAFEIARYLHYEVYGKLADGGVYQFKIPSLPTREAYDRADSGVIYFDSRRQQAVHDAVVTMGREHPEFFKEGHPAFTLPVYDATGKPLKGISFAQRPPRKGSKGSSVGLSRSEVLQSAVRLTRILEQKGETVSAGEFDQIVSYLLDKAGFDYNVPAINWGGQKLFPAFMPPSSTRDRGR